VVLQSPSFPTCMTLDNLLNCSSIKWGEERVAPPSLGYGGIKWVNECTALGRMPGI
jgi:hypothetical protein